tara:strand:- start:83 stop:187 length:105 start_codon:yes stop_codon:yes gene_type:complete
MENETKGGKKKNSISKIIDFLNNFMNNFSEFNKI